MACEIVAEEMLTGSTTPLSIGDSKPEVTTESNLDNFVNDFAGSDDSRSLW